MDKIDIRDLILRELKQNSVDENSSSNNKIIDNTDFEFIAESIVEKLPIYVVMQQRELLIALVKHINTYLDSEDGFNNGIVDEFMAINCA